MVSVRSHSKDIQAVSTDGMPLSLWRYPAVKVSYRGRGDGGGVVP